MLKNINPILTGDLLKVLSDMGQGNEIVIANGNFPSKSHARELVKTTERDTIEVVKAILSVFPLDESAGSCGHICEALATEHDPRYPDSEAYEQIRRDFAKHVVGTEVPDRMMIEFKEIEREEFYERAKRAYAIVATIDPRHYACFILRKGALPEPVEELAAEWADFVIEELELSGRPYNMLKRQGIQTVQDLVTRSREEIAKIEYLGNKSFAEIEEALAKHDLRLREP